MKKKAISKKTAIKKLASIGVVSVAVISLSINFIDGQIKLGQMQEQLQQIEAQTEVQSERNRELEILLETGTEDDFVIRIARDKYDFVYPGERVYVDITGQ